jgi:hypothetical protein
MRLPADRQGVIGCWRSARDNTTHRRPAMRLDPILQRRSVLAIAAACALVLGAAG